MYNGIDWTKRENKGICIANALRVTEYARRFTQGHRSFLGPGSEKKYYETHVNKLDGEWVKTAEGLMLNFAESGHPAFRASSASERVELKSRKKGVKSFHFNAGDDTIELILRTIISASQLSVHGAVTDLCGELARNSRTPSRMRIWNQWLYRHNFQLPTLFLRLMPKYRETCCVKTSRNSKNCLNNRN